MVLRETLEDGKYVGNTSNKTLAFLLIFVSKSPILGKNIKTINIKLMLTVT